MSLQSVMQQFRIEVQGLRPAANEEDLARLRRSCGPLPEQVVTLYQDHDGSDRYLAIPRKTLPLRLMPIAEVLKTRGERGLLTMVIRMGTARQWGYWHG